MSRSQSPWQRLPASARTALAAGLHAPVRLPAEALALYARWWQIESWLRSLAYVELRARYGSAWVDHVGEGALSRRERDRAHEYMATLDRDLPLAYLDAGKLFDLIDREWDLFKPALIDRGAWQGRAEELLKIRNRMGHLRRPHSDDLGRLEQTLRDLGPGCRRVTAAYADPEQPPDDLDDLVVAAWVRNEHDVAQRLDHHAQENYDTWFRLGYSLRPWAEPPQRGLSGHPGVIWQVTFTMRGRFLDLDRFWHDYYLDQGTRCLPIHVLADSPVRVILTFVAVGDGAKIADGIGQFFDALLLDSTPHVPESWITNWSEQWPGLDPRVQVGTPWSLAFNYADSGEFFEMQDR